VSAAVVYTNAPPKDAITLDKLFDQRNALRHLATALGHVRRHPDMKRQAGRRQMDRDLRAARALKAAPVALHQVDPTVYLERQAWDGRTYWNVITLQKPYYSSQYRVKVLRSCDEVQEAL
jgi:hypothetical protein